jgi:putative aminopeptidase
MKEKLKSRLRELSELNGVCGSEEDVVRYLRDEFTRYADEVSVDPLGNVIAIKNGSKPGPRIMLAAHSDEVGLCVKNILSNGFITFETIGAVGDKMLPAREVVILTRKGRLPGIIGEKSFHLQSSEEANKVRVAAELFIDVGASSREEVEAAGVRIGDRIVIRQQFTELLNKDMVSTKAIDNRLWSGLLIELLRDLKSDDFAGTVCAVVTIQEERAFTGAWYIGDSVKPDYAIVLDTIPAMDTPGNNPETAHPVWLGRGPACPVSYGAGGLQYTYFHIHPKMRELIEEHGERTNVNIQYLTALGSYGTDAPMIARSNNGTPTATLAIPRRYAHCPYEVVNMNDAADAYKVLKSIVLANGNKKMTFID